MKKISLLMIAKDAQETLENALKSVQGLVNEIVVVDSYSKDKTVAIAEKYGARVFKHEYEGEGQQRAYGLKKTSGEWVLVLDDDEVVSPELRKEIRNTFEKNTDEIGYIIPFQSYFLGRPVNYGGENYKMLRLFKKRYAKVQPYSIHSKIEITSGKVSQLKNKIRHYSYRSMPQLISKFTSFAWREARQKADKGEKVTLNKLLFYAPHMFWARFIEDKGYKDGFFRLPLDLAFAYMEFLTYFFLLIIKIRSKSSAFFRTRGHRRQSTPPSIGCER